VTEEGGPVDWEEWRDIRGFPGWAINPEGVVFSDATSRKMAIGKNQQGIATVRLMRDGKQHGRSVALLVAKAYLDPPRNEYYNSVIHLNGDKDDCRAVNLMWRPRWYALKYHRMFEDEPYRVSVYIPALDKVYSSLREFCTDYGLIEKSTYVDMLNGEPCFHYGWIVERHDT
jgi:hypothetical protein